MSETPGPGSIDPVPDVAGYVVGWCAWNLRGGLLCSSGRGGGLWAPADGLVERCVHSIDGTSLHCGCGVLVAKHPRSLDRSTNQLVGCVALWGRVVESPDGWRAERASVLVVFALPAVTPDARRRLGADYAVAVYGRPWGYGDDGASSVADAADALRDALAAPGVLRGVPPVIERSRATLIEVRAAAVEQWMARGAGSRPTPRVRKAVPASARRAPGEAASAADPTGDGLVGWRSWRYERRPDGRHVLQSPLMAADWPALDVFSGRCTEQRDGWLRAFASDPPGMLAAPQRAEHPVPQATCRCGIYAVKSIASLARYLDQLGGTGLLYGCVALCGRVVRGTQGWRAEQAYPLVLFASATVPDQACAGLQRSYGIRVHPCPRTPTRPLDHPAVAPAAEAVRARLESVGAASLVQESFRSNGLPTDHPNSALPIGVETVALHELRDLISATGVSSSPLRPPTQPPTPRRRWWSVPGSW